jgi:hypothetical protein
MSISTNQVTIGTAATLIASATNSDKCEITFISTANDVYIGKSDVTISNGLHLRSYVPITLKVGRDDAIYGITNTGTHTLSFWLYQPN